MDHYLVVKGVQEYTTDFSEAESQAEQLKENYPNDSVEILKVTHKAIMRADVVPANQ